MSEPDHLDDSTVPPLQSADGLTTEQTAALAKVYRFLLTLQNKRNKGDESQRQSSPEGVPHLENPVKPDELPG